MTLCRFDECNFPQVARIHNKKPFIHFGSSWVIPHPVLPPRFTPHSNPSYLTQKTLAPPVEGFMGCGSKTRGVFFCDFRSHLSHFLDRPARYLPATNGQVDFIKCSTAVLRVLADNVWELWLLIPVGCAVNTRKKTGKRTKLESSGI